MKKYLLLISLLLCSCNNVTSSLNKIDKLYFASNLKQEDLPKPNQTISSLEEFIYSLDYLAFYKIDKKVSFYISEEYAKSFYNIYQEFSKAQEQVVIADVYPTFMDYNLYVNYKIITLNVVIQDIAIKSNEKLEAQNIYKIDYKKGDYQHQIPLNVRWELKTDEWGCWSGYKYGSYSDEKYMFIMDVCECVYEELKEEDYDKVKQAYKEYREAGNPPILGEDGDEIVYE